MMFFLDSQQPHIDITGAENVTVEFRGDGNVLWVHVDGVTVLRVCQIVKFNIEPPSEGMNRL